MLNDKIQSNIQGVEHKTVSIGFMREDGDFQILATLNNLDELVGQKSFDDMVKKLCVSFTNCDVPVVVLERQETPDYVSLEDVSCKYLQKA